MAAIDEILASLPFDQIAQQVRASPQEVQQAAAAAVPALLGGLDANAQDPAGATSLLEALGQHQTDLLGDGLDLSQLDTNDGSAITSHIFGDNEDAVVSQLGGLGSGAGGSGLGGALIKKLLPILAPIVLSWIAKQVLGGGGTASAGPAPQQGAAPGGAGSLDDLLKDVLGGAVSGGAAAPAPGPTTTGGGMNAGSIITDILGGLLGGGRR